MLIRFGAYILLFALTLQSLYRSIMTVEYHVNLTEYIAQCLNKDRPELHCNGQCILMSKIHEGETDNGKTNIFHYDYSALYLHTEVSSLQLDMVKLRANERPVIIPQADYLYNYHARIFRPPIA